MSDTELTYSERVQPLVAAIEGELSAGEDLTYEPEFDEIKTELDKLTSMSGGMVDWGKVGRESEHLLSTRTKDLRLVTWFCRADVEAKGWEGFADGTAALFGMCEAHWDEMYPKAKRKRARGNQFTWLIEQLEGVLSTLPINLPDAAHIAQAQLALAQIDSLFRDKLEDFYTGQGKLRSLLENRLRELPDEEEAAPAEVAAPEAPADGEAAPAPAAASAPKAAAVGGLAISSAAQVDLSDIRTALASTSQNMVASANALRAIDPANPLAFRLLRQGLWMQILKAPRSKDGISTVEAPSENVREKLDTMAADEDHLGLLKEAERELSRNPYWIDLNRYVSVAMGNLGGMYADARSEVGRETAAFVMRVPLLLERKFQNEVPFASEATRGWLRAEATRWVYSESFVERLLGEEDADVQRRMQNAQTLVSRGKTGEGLSLALTLANHAGDRRTRFKRRLEFARLAIQTKLYEPANRVLSSLRDDLEKHDLMNWEPKLVGDLYTLMLESYQAEGRSLDDEQVEILYQLNPEAALKIAPPEEED